MLPIAVLGAGLAGLSAAQALTAAGRTVRLFDKGRAAGGRLATRRIEHAGRSHRFDHGAQYLRAERSGFAALLEAARTLPWPDAKRRVPSPGMSALGRHLAHGLDLQASRHAGALHRTEAGWMVAHWDAALVRPGKPLPETPPEMAGPFSAVLVTFPAEQARAILPRDFAAPLAPIEYAPCWTVMAAFPGKLDLPDTLRYHGPIGWAARDSAKPGRDRAQENWVIQAGPEFSREFLEAAPEEVIARLLAALPAPPPLFAVAHRWRYSLLEVALGQPCLWDASLGLGYASDGCLAGRAESAWESGQALAARVLGA
ncbi:NAD(P)-binding protein [Roseococcus sp. SDR]|uniref:NAD(P)/FAD-dependent oxidoreductase n=1 Tax=Roseococcus sp. SDR TaxID=2835532 RepID=UPI001BCF30B7|nr:NAD(P)-binding protein [Roseococcus sp. SDR]MBS7791001.1 NAD(P)-binding protein [Roseococcus sp. SDR]MBV1846315.1 NAD(P)-binding protein [Roseococcus sp. SDR]